MVRTSGHAIVFEGRLRIPVDACSFAGFRDWFRSGSFPERERIDYLAGDIEIEVSAAELHTHSAVQMAIASRLHTLFLERDLGEVFAGRTRVTSRVADFSTEPDVVGVLWESLEEGRVRYVAGAPPAGGGEPARCAEIDGPPDLVVEILSDGSARRDTEQLPRLYALAGVRELWIADARGPEVAFAIHSLRAAAYASASPDPQGWLRSVPIGRGFRLTREPTRGGTWRYVLEDRA